MVYNNCFDHLGPGYRTTHHLLPSSLRDFGHLNQEQVPRELIGSSYMKMFGYMLKEHKKLCIGLYRHESGPDQHVWFVSLNPDPNTILRKQDAVFLFGKL